MKRSILILCAAFALVGCNPNQGGTSTSSDQTSSSATSTTATNISAGSETNTNPPTSNP